MKRRTILGSIGVVVVTPAGGTALYGTPASITGPVGSTKDMLFLPLSGTNIPAQTLGDIKKYQALWTTVFADAVTRSDFRRDPGKYLRQEMLPPAALGHNDSEVRLLQALSDDEILATSMRGDYKGFLARLNELGLVQRGAPSNLKRRVMEAMKQNMPEIRDQAKALSTNPDSYLKDLLESKELRYLYSQLTPSIEQVAMVAVPVAIAAIVVTYISVAVGVTVAIMAGVYISIAVSMGVVASGGDHGFNHLGMDFQLASSNGGGPPSNWTSRSDRQRNIDHGMATRLLIGKRMLALDPERLREAQVVSRAARLLKQHAFVLEANRQLVRDEIGAFVAAAEEINLISIPLATRQEVIQAMEQLALRAAALD